MQQIDAIEHNKIHWENKDIKLNFGQKKSGWTVALIANMSASSWTRIMLKKVFRALQRLGIKFVWFCEVAPSLSEIQVLVLLKSLKSDQSLYFKVII